MRSKTEPEEPAAPAPEVAALLAEWRAEEKKQNLWRRGRQWLVSCLFALLCLTLYLLPSENGGTVFVLLVLFGCIALPIIAQGGFARRLSPVQIRLLPQLADIGGVHALRPLLSTFRTTERMAQGLAADALIQLLKSLPPEEVEALQPEMRRRMHTLLQSETAARHPQLTLAWVEQLPSIVDQQALVLTAGLLVRNYVPGVQKVDAVVRVRFPELLARVDFGGKYQVDYWIRRLLPYQQGLALDRFLRPILALTQLLPQLMTREFRDLLPNDRRRLYRFLANPYYNVVRDIDLAELGPALYLAVIDLVMRTEDQEATPYIRRLAHDFTFGRLPGVNEAARRCLERLTELERKTQISKTLLRGSSAPPDDPHDLLRPAAGGPEENPALLLRADGARSKRSRDPFSSDGKANG